MTDRKTLDQMTSDDLDQLYDQLDALRQVARGYCPTCGRGDAAPTVQDWEQQRDRAERADAAIERVRALRDDLREITGARYIADALDNILDQPAPTAATQPTDARAQRGQAVIDGWIQIIDYAHGEEQP